MARRERSAVERYHDRVAGIYDTIYDNDPYWETVFEITWRHVKKFLPRDMSTRCLDVGCGTGRWGLKILKSGFTTDFLDISQKMLDRVAGKLSNERQAADMPRLIHASVDDLSVIESETYDFVIGQGDPLNCAEKPERAFKELTRVLKSGGVMVMSVDNKLAGIYHYFKENDLPGLERFLKTGKTNWVTDAADEQYPLVMFAPDDIRRMCAARGLELLSLIGKTVLPLRRYRKLLEDKEKRRRLVKLEERYHAAEALLANAAHLEFAAKKGVCGRTGC